MTRRVRTGARAPLTLLPFVAAALASAALLFWIQPLFSKTLLPLAGGAPLVWNTTLVFYQLVLLAGYAYAHLLSGWAGRGRQLAIHLGLYVLAFSFLPVGIAIEFPDDKSPVLGLLMLLAASVGLPVMAVSATAPLLQRWFGETDHPLAGDPYFLYAASNAGSMLALLAFPFVLEPLISLSGQRRLWSIGFLGLAAMMALCGLLTLRSSSATGGTQLPRVTAEPVSWSRRLHWMALAGVPASLLLGVTQHITTDIASVPLLWILPLLVYLLTYVLAFSRRHRIPDTWVYRGEALALAVAGVWIWALTGIRAQIALHTVLLFVLALACHWELANRRPRTGNLTEFYLFVSLGGVLGGAFNTILAPLLFTNTIEYGLAAALACMLRPGAWGGRGRQRVMDFGWPLALFVGGVALMRGTRTVSMELYPYAFLALILVFVVVGFGFRNRPLRYGLTVAVFLVVGVRVSVDRNVIRQERSWFGTYDVVFSEEDNANLLFHGTTIHGAQMLDPNLRARPTSYYTESGPLGQVFAMLRPETGGMSVGLVGLGIGTALCYAQAADTWTVYEIDPLVFALASDPAYFHHWAQCARRADTALRIGDARVRIRKDDASFDLLILDAYSSDAIPVHLITLEALELYRQRLRPGGAILFHISNRHLALDRVLAGLARETGMAAFIQEHHPDNSGRLRANASVWVALGEGPDGLGPLRDSGLWDPLESSTPILWRDDYSDILGVLR